MADDNEIKGLLGAPLGSHRRYGSTSTNMKKPEYVVVHSVNKGDTIQGIALKYGVTVELLKQHNKLWTSESMFLHDYLEIPVSRSDYENIIKQNPSAAQIPQSPSPSSPSLTNGSSCRESDIASSCSETSGSPHLRNGGSTKLKSPTSPNGLYDACEKSSDDILNKIDSNIAIMKSNIQKMETYSYPMLDQMEVDDSCKRSKHKRYSSDSHAHPNCWAQRPYQNGHWEDPTLPPRTIVTNPSRTITMSLKRLLRDQEEICEL